MAATNIVASAMGCAGQRCMAASVLILVGDCQEILDKIVALTGQIELGRDMGAVISSAAKERISGYIDSAESEGARILVDGREISAALPTSGSYVGPTIIDGIGQGSACVSDEIFGPVLSILRVDSLDEALTIENASPYGNAASIYTRSGAAAEHYSAQANAGMIPFGGWNASRFGVGDMTGAEGIRFWTQIKKITSKWSSNAARNWMS
ncbi:MAG: aldehyde dehydrogenase family protein [Verrucomicrobiia bacterium]